MPEGFSLDKEIDEVVDKSVDLLLERFLFCVACKTQCYLAHQRKIVVLLDYCEDELNFL